MKLPIFKMIEKWGKSFWKSCMVPWCLVFIICLHATVCDSQPLQKEISPKNHNYITKSWTSENGFIQDYVHDMIQSKDGYLWIATTGGLVQFDGQKFEPYDAYHNPGLTSSRLISVAEGSNGRIWVGMEHGGLAVLENEIIKSSDYPNSLKLLSPRMIVEDQNETVWFGTLNGLGKFSKGSFYRYDSLNGLPGNFIQSLQMDIDGIVWVGTDSGLAQITNDSIAIVDRTIGKVESMALDSVGHLIIGASTGLYVISGKGIQLINPLKNITKIVYAPNNTIWVKTIDSTHVLKLGNSGGSCFVKQVEKLSGSNSINSLSILASDREGNIWASGQLLGNVADNGLTRIRKSFFTSYEIGEGFGRSLVLGADSSVILSYDANSIFLIKDGAVTTRTLTLDDERFQSVFLEPSGKMWVGGYGEVYEINNQEKIIHELGLNSYTRVRVMYRDTFNNFWIGTEGGLCQNLENEKKIFTTSDGLVGNNIRFLTEDSHGNLWIGTTKGISVYDGHNFTNYTIEHGLPKGIVGSIYQDKGGIIWIGIYEGGLSRFENGVFTNYGTREGLFDNFVVSLLEDDEENIWISSNQGVSYINKALLNAFAKGEIKQIQPVSFSHEDGFGEAIQGVPNASIKTSDGKLVFSTLQGVVIVDPSKRIKNEVPPLLAIESITFNDTVSISYRKELIVPPGSGNMKFQFSALSFSRPDRLQFQYQLVGYESKWVKAGNRREAFYTNLEPGTYQFKMTASNDEGVWNDENLSITVTVLPHYYETQWFRVIAVFLFGFLIIFIFKVRVNGINKRNRELSNEVKNRQKIQMAYMESEKKLDFLTKSITDGIWEWDVKADEIVWSKEFNDHFGFENITKFDSAFVDSIIHPDDLQLQKSVLRKHLNDKKPFEIELRMKEEGKGYLWYSIRGTSITKIKTDPIILGTITDITDRKEAEMELKKSIRVQAILNKSTEISLTGTWEYEIGSETTSWSDIMWKIFDLEDDYIPKYGQYISDHVSENFRSKMAKFISDALYNGKPYDAEMEVDTGKSIKWIRTIGVPEKRGEKVVGLFGIVQDLTDHKKAKEALVESQGKYKQLLELAHEGIWVVNENYVTTFVNPSMAMILGCKIEDMIGKSAGEFVGEQGIEIFEPYEESWKGEARPLRDFEFTHKNGKKVYVVMETEPIFDNHGNKKGSISGVMDITDRRIAQDELKRNQAKYLNLYSFAPTAHYSIDSKGFITEVNKRGCQLLGYTSKELIGKREMFIYANTPNGIEKAKDVLSRFLSGEKIESEEVEINHKDGHHILASVTVGYQMDHNNKLIGTQLSLINITERKQAEKERARLMQELEMKNDEMERFTYTVSHDLKSPLITIKGFIGMLEKDIKKDDINKVMSDLNFINSAADNMNSLLEKLLVLSRALNAKTKYESVDLGAVITMSLQNVQGQILETKANITVDTDLPHIECDEQRIVEVFQNLIDNAIKFRKPDKSPNIKIKVQQTDTSVCCIVEDDGIGIDPKYEYKVFELFERIESGVPGTGIGLALVKRVIEKHNGSIRVESSGLGKGCAFYVTLPLIAENQDVFETELEMA